MITLLLTIAIIGVIVWFIVTYLPMPEPFKKGIVVISVILVILYVLNAFGIGGDVPRLR